MITCGYCKKRFCDHIDWQRHMVRSHREKLSDKNIEGLKDAGVINNSKRN